jgi:hypothetical protein
MIYTWTIEKLTVAEDNLVTKVDWRVTATDSELTASAAGTRTLIRGDSFIPYEQLTEQQVLDWCFEPEVITLEDQTTITNLLKNKGETQVAGQIARQLAQKESEPALPWLKIPA